ncbi:MAG: ISL3 family transposase [Nakamurella sp.]
MSSSKVMQQVLAVQGMVVEDVTVESGGGKFGSVVVATVRCDYRTSGRCGRCRRPCAGYDQGAGLRRWRTIDTGTMVTYLQARAPRVSCPDHGVQVAHVPWARPGAKMTLLLEDVSAWSAANMTVSAVTVLLRLSWRTVAAIVTRVVADLLGRTDPMAGLVRIGIDEISYRKGHRYLTCVVDHDTGRLVWAAPGRNTETLGKFFTALGPERASQLSHVSADGADWIHRVVAERAPQALICMHPFHVVAWAMKGLDKVRHRTLAAAGVKDRNARWAVAKNPINLTADQKSALERIKDSNDALYTAYLLKEQLRVVFEAKGERGREVLAGWLSAARSSGLPEFVRLAATVDRYRQLILNTLEHNVSNARSEATNCHLRALTKRAYGYRTPEALIAMGMLTRGGLTVALPGRN